MKTPLTEIEIDQQSLYKAVELDNEVFNMKRQIFQPIIQEGVLVGWRVFEEGGVLGALRWVGYIWENK